MTAGQNRIPVNLDYAASTPMRAEALLAQREYDDSVLAGVNPNSLHSLGRKAAARLEVARREIARSFGARVRPSEIILTNGGTEANQLALLGLAEGARQRDRKRDRVIVSAIEHDSILDNLPLLRAAGFTVDLVQPCRAGYIEPAALVELLGDDVALVSIMVANNETGVVQPIRELAAAAHAAGALFHTDAIQGYLHIPIDVTELGVDAMTVAAHKIGGPVASGALYLKNHTPLRPRIFGGSAYAAGFCRCRVCVGPQRGPGARDAADPVRQALRHAYGPSSHSRHDGRLRAGRPSAGYGFDLRRRHGLRGAHHQARCRRL